MNVRSLFAAAAIAAAGTLTACGGNSSLPPPPGPPGLSPAVQTEQAVSTANDVGAPMSETALSNQTMSSPLQPASLTQMATAQAAGDGTCSSGVEFFSPDKKGDAGSTERIVFYDNGCTKMQSDDIRIFKSTGASSETVQQTVSRYPLNAASPSSVRTENITFNNASFDKFGYPIYKNGFSRSQIGQLTVSGVKTILSDGELVVRPAIGNSTTYCSDSAGYSSAGDASLNETFGWNSVVAKGTRTVNSDGSITWNFTHGGNTFTGALGALSIQTGAQNATCPISTPMFKLAGGQTKGTSVLPIQSTYKNGVLTNLTITNATLTNGDTLNVQTAPGVAPSDSRFIAGTLSKGTTKIATLNVNAFGDGTLLVLATGKTYHIEDWHVSK